MSLTWRLNGRWQNYYRHRSRCAYAKNNIEVISSPYNNTHDCIKFPMLIPCDSALPFYSPLSLQHQSNRTHPHTEHYDVQKAHMWGKRKPNLWISFIFCWQSKHTQTHILYGTLIGDWIGACVYNFKHGCMSCGQIKVAYWLMHEEMLFMAAMIW